MRDINSYFSLPLEKMKEILANIRKNPPKEMGGQPLVFDDFAQGLYGLPSSDVLRFKNDQYRIIIRPSGTEPKMKIYLQSKGDGINALNQILLEWGLMR